MEEEGKKGNWMERVEGELPHGKLVSHCPSPGWSYIYHYSFFVCFCLPSHMIFLNHVPLNLILQFIIESLNKICGIPTCEGGCPSPTPLRWLCSNSESVQSMQTSDSNRECGWW